MQGKSWIRRSAIFGKFALGWILPFVLWMLHTKGWNVEARLLGWLQGGALLLFLFPFCGIVYHLFLPLQKTPSVIMGAGLSVLAVILYFIGTAGLLYPEVIGGVWLLAWLPEVLTKGKFLRTTYSAIKEFLYSPWGISAPWGILAAWIACAGPGSHGVLYPAVDCDASLSHLTLPKIYLHNHQIVDAWWTRAPFLPQSQHLLYSGAILFIRNFTVRTDLIANFFGLVQLLGVSLALGDLVRRRGSGMTSFLLLLSYPVIRWSASTVYLDIPLTFYIGSSVVAGVRGIEALRSGGKSTYLWACLTGWLAGMVLTVKHMGAFFLFPLGLLLAGYILVLLLSRKVQMRMVARVASAGIVGGIIPVLIFYARNYVKTGNPFFPFFFFPEPNGYHWTSESLKAFQGAIHHWTTEHTWYAPFLALWKVATDERVYTDTYEYPVGPLLGVQFALALVGSIWMLFRRREADWRIILSFGVFLIQAVSWYFSSPVIRYLIPCLAVLSLAPLTILFFEAKGVRIVVAVLLGIGAVITQRHSQVFYRPFLPPLSLNEVEPYLVQHLPTGKQLQWLSHHTPPEATVYSYGDSCSWLSYPRAFVGDWFGLGNYGELFAAKGDREKLLSFFKSLGIEYILDRRLSNSLPAITELTSSASECFELMHEAHSQYAEVYRIKYEVPTCQAPHTLPDIRGDEIESRSPDLLVGLMK